MSFTIGALLAASLLLQLPSTPPSTTAPATRSSLIEQLSDPDTSVRDAAQAALRAADPSVVDQLKSARDQSSDPDVLLRLDALIVQFEESEAIGATRITLKFNEAPLKEVLAELSRQSKLQFSDPNPEFGNEPPRITIDVENVTFWQALNELRRVGRLGITPQPDIWRIGRNHANPMFGPGAVEAGAFLIQPFNISYNRSITYIQNNNTSESFAINFQMISEPKIRLAQSAGQFRLVRAVDSNGNNLVGPQPVQTFGIGQNMFHISSQLTYPKNPGEKIAELTGTVKLSIARRVETIAIDDFGPSSKPVERMIDGAKLTLQPGEPTQGQPNWVSVTVVVEPQGDPMLLNRLQATLRQMRVTDSAGRALQMNQFQANPVNAQRGEYRLSYMPMNNLPNAGPYKLVFDIPMSYREVEVPITIRDLPMP